jgi:hypothetical protein
MKHHSKCSLAPAGSLSGVIADWYAGYWGFSFKDCQCAAPQKQRSSWQPQPAAICVSLRLDMIRFTWWSLLSLVGLTWRLLQSELSQYGWEWHGLWECNMMGTATLVAAVTMPTCNPNSKK